jgi:flagellar biosynthetic protein FliP
MKQANEADIELFLDFSNVELNISEKVPIYVLIPAFIISELKSAFQIGFLIYLPFVVIDLLISNVLLTLGMFMLSPAMVSMPFKFLLFILVDGWNLIIRGLLLSYQ